MYVIFIFLKINFLNLSTMNILYLIFHRTLFLQFFLVTPSPPRDAVIGRIGHVLHHLESLLKAIASNYLVCICMLI